MVNCEWFTLRVKTGKENSVKEFIEKEKTEFGIIDENDNSEIIDLSCGFSSIFIFIEIYNISM